RRAQQLGLERLAIVDLDVHHGNGTQEVFYEDGRVLYCSLHQWPLYPGTGAAAETGAGAGVGANINLPLAPGTGPGPWLGALRERVVPALERHRPQLLLVSCGYDALAGDPLAALELAPETYQEAAAMLAEVAQQTCQGRLLWLLEGGYDLEAMPEAVRRCALVLAGLSPSTLGEDAGATT
ncbi:MAG: histone deacetylase family protein, partial [Candidatus Dormibacteria bacterium]